MRFLRNLTASSMRYPVRQVGGGNRVRRGPYTAYYDIGSGLVEDR